MSGLIFTSNCPCFTESPSSINSSRISPETSGASLTSGTGCTDPEALTFSTMVLYLTLAMSTSISLGSPIQPIDFPIANTTMIRTAAAISHQSVFVDFPFCFAINQVLKIDGFVLIEIEDLFAKHKVVLRSGQVASRLKQLAFRQLVLKVV